jgi:hypothetical protein
VCDLSTANELMLAVAFLFRRSARDNGIQALARQLITDRGQRLLAQEHRATLVALLDQRPRDRLTVTNTRPRTRTTRGIRRSRYR